MKKLSTKEMREIQKQLHTAKDSRDPLLAFLLEHTNDYLILFLLDNPKVFKDQETYERFRKKYKDYHPKTSTTEIMDGGESITFTYNLRQRVIKTVQEIFKRKHDLPRPPDKLETKIQTTLEKDKIIQETTQKYQESHKKRVERIRKTRPQSIEKQAQIDEIKEKYKVQTKREHKRYQKNLDNRVKWRKAQMLQGKERPKYKVWDQTPNPKTRHTITDGQKVLLDEKFTVINDKTGDVDYCDHPGDWTCSASNAANCLCGMHFTNNSKGYDEDTEKSILKKSDNIKKGILDRRQYHDLAERERKLLNELNKYSDFTTFY